LKPRAIFALCAALALAASAAPPALTTIYPSGDELPANHLKFYIHFTEPMREGVFLEHCRLLDERDKPVLEPFRETELWSSDHRRLTLWLHPGRQKTGVNLNDDFGPVLVPGRRYTLVISGSWPSAAGVPLSGEVKKTFRTGPRATAQLDPSLWEITTPDAATRQPLEVRFPVPLDHALLTRCLRILDAKGTPLAGAVEVTDAEKTWRFTPRESWSAVVHRLAVEAILEDLAGNSLARPFEVDLEAPPPRQVPPVVTIPFRPAAPTR
jgi:hypothetical protein